MNIEDLILLSKWLREYELCKEIENILDEDDIDKLREFIHKKKEEIVSKIKEVMKDV